MERVCKFEENWVQRSPSDAAHVFNMAVNVWFVISIEGFSEFQPIYHVFYNDKENFSWYFWKAAMQGGMSSSQQQEMEVKQVIFEMATYDSKDRD